MLHTHHQDYIAILNICEPNTRVPKLIKETLLQLKSHTDSHTVVMGDINTLPSPIDRSLRQKLNQKLQELTDIIQQMDLKDIYRTFKPNTKAYIFLSVAHGTFSKLTTYMDAT